MASFKYVLNKSREYTYGEFPIFLRINHKYSRKLISTKFSISVDHWDEKNGSVLLNSKSKVVNRKLLNIKSSLEAKFNAFSLKLSELETKKKHFSIHDIAALFETDRKSNNVLKYFDTLIQRLETIGKTGNAAVYKDARASFEKFRDEKDLTFEELTYKTLIDFESYLLSKGKKINTISIYMRTLRAVYNKAINEDLASKDLYPFNKYKIKHEKTSKRAIVKANISDIKNLDLSKQPDLQKARDYFMFSFYCRGMSFVDMAHLKVSNISDGRIYYSRNKTNQKFTIKITPQVQEIIQKYSDLKIKDSYIFPIIIDPEGDIYTQYRNAMRLTNKKLKKIGEILELNIPLTTYVSRHSWATIAKREGISTAIISEGLGHESEKTTQIYLDSFENDVLDDANSLITSL